MNTNNKMFLIPENELKARTHIQNVLSKDSEHETKKEPKGMFEEIEKMLSSSLPAAMKVKLFNHLLSLYMTKKSQKNKKTEKVEGESKIEPKEEIPDSSKTDLSDGESEAFKTPETSSILKIYEQDSSTPRRKRKRVKTPKQTPVKTKNQSPKIPRRTTRQVKPVQRYQAGKGRIIPIKWTSLRKF